MTPVPVAPTTAETPASVRTVTERFEAQAERTPGEPALIFGDQTLSYGELNRWANRLAWLLRERGVGPETLVGICLPDETNVLSDRADRAPRD